MSIDCAFLMANIVTEEQVEILQEDERLIKDLYEVNSAFYFVKKVLQLQKDNVLSLVHKMLFDWQHFDKHVRATL